MTDKSSTPTSPHWWPVGAAMFAVAWGGNEFTPLLTMYRQRGGMASMVVDLLLAAYVLGIIPAMLLGGPLSDRCGRRPLLLPAPIFAMAGSATLAAGADHAVVLAVGRVLSGIALGLAMAVGTSWIKELSPGGEGPQRASISLTAGFGLGAGVAAVLAEFGPKPDVLPYLVNILVTVIAGIWLTTAAETRHRNPAATSSLRDDLRIPAVYHDRFIWVVAPMAPWVFGCAASAYAILPALLLHKVEGFAVAFAGAMCLVALGVGVAIQGWARRLDDPSSARGVLVALAAVIPGMALAALTAATSSLALALIAAATLGLAYGLLLVAGLQEVQRIAGPDDLAGLTAVFYSITYLGFFVPAALAGIENLIGYPVMFAAGAVLAAITVAVVAVADHRRRSSSTTFQVTSSRSTGTRTSQSSQSGR